MSDFTFESIFLYYLHSAYHYNRGFFYSFAKQNLALSGGTTIDILLIFKSSYFTGYLSIAASGSFSSLKFNDYDIFEKNIKYVYTRNVFNKLQGTENIQKQSFRNIFKDSFLKILKYSQEISMVELLSRKKNKCYSFSETVLNSRCLPSNWKI